MRRPLGCMTFSALVAALLVVLAIAAAAVVTGNGIFSPGDLSAFATGHPTGGVDAHADLAARCDACHAPILSGERMADRCLACHTAVSDEVVAKAGLHGRLPDPSTRCRDCHTDHRGAAASLTLADTSVFPHEETGFSLVAHTVTDATSAVGCRDCHPASPVTFKAPTCAACHESRDATYMAEHERTFGTNCLECHDGVDRYGASFTHSTYPLVKGHDGPACGECHARATTVAALQATATTCISCHADRDIHEGRLGTSCQECHADADWTGATIDHDRTRFPLVGKHVGPACEACHAERKWTGIGLTCVSCHASDDPHDGQFKGDCARCHTASGWKDLTFDHASTAFPLKGAHATTGCAECHAGGRYAGTPTACIGCHAADDAHDGSLGKDCAACHSVKAWQPATFDHDTSAFPLTGAHRTTGCRDCHIGGLFRGTPKTCYACHSADDEHKGSFGKTCASCHSTRAWQPATFDHDKSAFPLTGAHRTTGCRECHIGGLFKGTPKTCYACHSGDDAHKGAFGKTCASCHSTKAWQPAKFDHDKSAFPLTGAHRTTGCRECHIGGLFKGTPKTCVSCHDKPKSHGTAVGNSCGTCHSTKAWKPASFTQAHRFPVRHGGAGGTCSKCHPSTWSSYTCSRCHSNASMTEHHKEVRGFSLTACVRCHPTGRGD